MSLRYSSLNSKNERPGNNKSYEVPKGRHRPVMVRLLGKTDGQKSIARCQLQSTVETEL